MPRRRPRQNPARRGILKRRGKDAHRQSSANVLGEVQSDREVLSVKLDLGSQRVVVVDHWATAVREHPRARRTSSESIDDPFNVEARFQGKCETLGDAQVRARDHHLID